MEMVDIILNKKWWRDAYQFLIKSDGGMPTISQWTLWRYECHSFPFLYKYDGRIPTMPFHSEMKMIEGPLPILHKQLWRDAYFSSMCMMDVCILFLLISLDIWWRDTHHFMLIHFQIEIIKGPLPILHKKYWKDAYRFLREMMEICLHQKEMVGISPSSPLKNGRHPSITCH